MRIWQEYMWPVKHLIWRLTSEHLEKRPFICLCALCSEIWYVFICSCGLCVFFLSIMNFVSAVPNFRWSSAFIYIGMLKSSLLRKRLHFCWNSKLAVCSEFYSEKLKFLMVQSWPAPLRLVPRLSRVRLPSVDSHYLFVYLFMWNKWTTRERVGSLPPT